MADILEFTTAKRRKEPIFFVLDGEKFEFTPPKSAMMVLSVLDSDADENSMIRSTFDWLGKGLPQERIDRLVSRLKDEDDDFDLENLVEIVRSLGEEISGRPTT